MLIHTLAILILGIGFSLYGFYIKKKPYFLIQNSFNLSNKIISNEAIQLYANKMSKITRGFGVFFIAFSLIQYFVDMYITIEKYTIFQLKSIPVLIVCEDKKSYLNAG